MKCPNHPLPQTVTFNSKFPYYFIMQHCMCACECEHSWVIPGSVLRGHPDSSWGSCTIRDKNIWLLYVKYAHLSTECALSLVQQFFQGSLLADSEIIRDTGNQTCICHRQGKSPTHCLLWTLTFNFGGTVRRDELKVFLGLELKNYSWLSSQDVRD